MRSNYIVRKSQVIRVNIDYVTNYYYNCGLRRSAKPDRKKYRK